ncbi:MAG: hypothetical protein NTW78_02715 [Campylobacterales bacterium]|nr:hypothetical protein [Campylobacterales bacterium]
MVKILFIFLLFYTFVFGEEIHQEDTLLTKKIKTFIKESTYQQNKAFIDIIFSPNSNFYVQNRVDVVKVAQTLKDNGLLNLFFNKPQELKLTFKTAASPQFFVKIMGDSLGNMGYYRYVTTESNLNSSQFTWSIVLNSEYATDPVILQKELHKSGCKIIDIQKNSATDWEYTIDLSNANLAVNTLKSGAEFELKRSLNPHWIDVSALKTLKITSSSKNTWYPHIVYYDASLNLLEVIKQDEKTVSMMLEIPSHAKYIKISDLYSLKNIKDDLLLFPN